MNTIKNQVKADAKTLAAQIARQIAQEPFEVLKDTPDQILGRERGEEKPKEAPKKVEKEEDKKVEHEKSMRLAQAYESELRDIRREELFRDLQKRIQLGEDVDLGNFTQLSWEQREVLEAQKVAIRERLQVEGNQGQGGAASEPTTKPKRGLFAGIKTRVARMQRKSEVKPPPSG